MDKRVISAIILFSVLFVYSASPAENELTLEAAGGVASEELPFNPDWSGAVKPGGLLAREFAFRVMCASGDNIYLTLTAGYLRDYYTPEFRILFPPNPYGPTVSKGGITYGRPTARLEGEWLKLEIGVFLYAYDSHNPGYIFSEDIFGPSEDPRPVLGIELGERDIFVFGNYLNSFPFVFGGAYEMGFIKRISGIYEHKIYASVAGYRDIALAYRGDFRIYKDIAITPGLSWGLRDRDSAYMLTLGVKAVFNYPQKKTFN